MSDLQKLPQDADDSQKTPTTPEQFDPDAHMTSAMDMGDKDDPIVSPNQSEPHLRRSFFGR